MRTARSHHKISASLVACLLAISPFTCSVRAQSRVDERPKPDVERALSARTDEGVAGTRKGGYMPAQSKTALPARNTSAGDVMKAEDGSGARRPPARLVRSKSTSSNVQQDAISLPRIPSGTPLSWILHTSQLSISSSAGTVEEYVDATGDLVADERSTFDVGGGAFDVAAGRSGARYEVYSATLNNRRVGVLVVALDTNGDYARDSSATFDLERDFGLPSAVSVVSGTSRAGREFVIVSSSGYYNFNNPDDPNNEPSAGVVLLVRDPSTGGFDNSLSRSLVRVGSNQLNNANALALLPNNDLLIADFDSDELRVVRDTNGDGIPDTLDPTPYYRYRFSDDAPLDIATNSRGVVFSHSVGNNTVMLALYDDNQDGRADRDEVIEDASGAADLVKDGGNLGAPQIDAFPDPALNGVLRDGSVFAGADNASTQALSGLAFGVETVLPAVAHLTMTNSASLRGNGTKGGLATILGAGLTLGRSGNSSNDASARGVQVRIEGRTVPVLSFSDSQINIYVPDAAGTGTGSVVVYVNGNVTAADDVAVSNDNPGLFTVTQKGAGEAIALMTSGMQYTRSPFNARTSGQPTVIALFGTGWRNSLPVTVSIGGQNAVVEYAGQSGGFNGLDQINVQIPGGITGALPVIVKTASGATSRTDVMVTIK
ncbi:MAG: IPT/TIG domain-containing protein [Acidobacteriota bacterium]|nr:IPT/TIG domain-containing protein [Acidobacteriota bacterium]